MPVFVQCPNPTCGKSGKVSPHFLGLPVRCPDCHTKFKAKASTVAEYPTAEPYLAPPDFPLDDGDTLDHVPAGPKPEWVEDCGAAAPAKGPGPVGAGAVAGGEG